MLNLKVVPQQALALVLLLLLVDQPQVLESEMQHLQEAQLQELVLALLNQLEDLLQEPEPVLQHQ